jgi:hypothetical protein
MQAMYKCNSNKCKKKTLYTKKPGEEFPEFIVCEHCYGNDTRRIWEPLQYNVKKQQCGNAKNGYTGISNMHDFNKD